MAKFKSIGIMAIFKQKRFDLYWMGEIKEGGIEVMGKTVASSKTLPGIRKYARMKKITDDDHVIHEIGPEKIGGFILENVVAEHKIKP